MLIIYNLQYAAILVEIADRVVAQLYYYNIAGLGQFITIKYKFHIHLG